MLLIMSGSYVQQELGAEFGSIPPSFLPLANKRLFKHQVSLGHDGHAIYLVYRKILCLTNMIMNGCFVIK